MNERPSFFTSIAALILILGLGLAIRLYDLTDLPLDFHPTRQLLSALKARGMYYQSLTDAPADERSFAIQQWKFRASVEPEFFERIVAFTYKFTGEQLWVSRIYSSAFWVIGAVFLFLLARRLTSTDGALAATAFYLFLPYAVTASRSFQPDPLMVMLIILFWWAIYEWANTLNKPLDHEGDKGTQRNQNVVTLRDPSWLKSWSFAILAGLFGGFAIFIKFVAAFFIIGGGVGALLLGRRSLPEVLKQPQIYVMTVLGILPGAAYFIYGVFIAGYLGQQFGGRFIPAYFLNPSYYFGWVNMLNLVIGGIPLMFALLGIFFFVDKGRRFILSLWAGYALFGIYFNYHISTHDYYSLPLIPIAALSIAPLADLFFKQLAKLTTTHWLRFTVYCLLLTGIFMSLWNIRTQMNSVDYRPEAQMWAEISRKVDGYNLAGLTQDYGSRLAYWGWRSITSWPTYGDQLYHNDLRGAQTDFENQFAELAAKKDLFVVTDFTDLERQPFLEQKLAAFPIFAEGDGYVIYDLRSP
ncbi:MAG: glycosyltransferase family 39 protein [Anaerolineales bacterium]|nr:glycosyltransferase family 39 protein [Anaerolineales bacterium]